MKKNKIISAFLVAVIVCTSIFSNVFGANFPEEDVPANNPLEGTIGNIWATVAFIAQVLSISCVVILGIRYMLASASQKADMKKGLTMVIIGSIFVFCAATVAEFIVDAGEQIL